MLQTVRLSSKRQITIPVKIYKALNLNQGDNLVVEVKDNTIILQKAQKALDDVAGSLSLPMRYKHRSLESIINEAKQEYFAGKK